MLLAQAPALRGRPVDLGPQPVELVQEAAAARAAVVRVVVGGARRAAGPRPDRDQAHVIRLRGVPVPVERGHQLAQQRHRQQRAARRAPRQRAVPGARRRQLAGQRGAVPRDPRPERRVRERPEVGQHRVRDARQQRAAVARVRGHVAQEPRRVRGLQRAARRRRLLLRPPRPLLARDRGPLPALRSYVQLPAQALEVAGPHRAHRSAQPRQLVTAAGAARRQLGQQPTRVAVRGRPA